MELYTLILAILPIITGFGGIYYGNRLSSKSQIKQSKLLSLIEHKKKWMGDLRNEVAEYVVRWSEYQHAEGIIKLKQYSTLSDNEWNSLTNDLMKAFTLLISSKLKVDCLLDKDIENHNELDKLLRELLSKKITENISKKDVDGKIIVDKDELAGTLLNKIIFITSKILLDETKSLKSIEKEIN